MKEKINIATILKDKPQGTKLYSRICGAVELKKVINVRKKKSIVISSPIPIMSQINVLL